MHSETNTSIDSTALVRRNVSIGPGVWIGAFAVIGAQPEHRDYHAKDNLDFGVVLGANSVIREGVLIQEGTHKPTIIGDNSFIMGNSTIGHDSMLGSEVTIGPGSHIAGESALGNRVTLGMGTTIHQKSIVGELVMTSMNCVVKGNVAPFLTLVGPSGKVVGANSVGIQRAGLGGGGWIEIYLSNLSEIYKGKTPFGLPKEVDLIVSKWFGELL